MNKPKQENQNQPHTKHLVESYLYIGKENAVKGKVLCKKLCVDARTMRAMIQERRRAGIPIVASKQKGTCGYYIAKDDEEKLEYIRSVESEIKELCITKNTLKGQLLNA